MGAPYAIGSDHLPGLSKLVEERGEAAEALAEFALASSLGRVGQVAGKIIGLGHMGDHWDGSNLKTRMEEEIGDLMAATNFFVERNGLDYGVIQRRVSAKLALFDKWHAEAQATTKAAHPSHQAASAAATNKTSSSKEAGEP